MQDLHEMSDNELHSTIYEAEDLLRQRAEERRKLEARKKDLETIGEWLETNEFVNCGNCSKCGYASNGTRNKDRPHGPYAYLYYPSSKTASGMTSRYVAQNRVEEVRARHQEMRQKNAAEVRRLSGAEDGSEAQDDPDPFAGLTPQEAYSLESVQAQRAQRARDTR